ncbi:F-box/kelch-repeat protein At3g06240-like [Rutidosis leptorrhynchoides]|uniref:F-box/kelch-repeat protein At3g06240-like n=1 Tax=Rutidosis leptorrhynchoides TaxID=125765 RepID=UPI003A98DAAF
MSDLSRKRCATEGSVLPYDIIFKILLLLPAKDLSKLSVVCKTWRRLISSPYFVQLHTSRCETVLTFLKHAVESHPNTLSIDDTNNGRFTLFKPTFEKGKRHIYLSELKDKNIEISDPHVSGFGYILATCDGLVIATNKKGTLLVVNPTTRKLRQLKQGTIVRNREESYGFVFSIKAREYKAVHLFRDESGHIDSEILSLKTMCWRGCNVPASGLFRDFHHKAVAASGVLYWLPGRHGVDYVVSMDIEDEKFVRKPLPVNSSGLNDRLIENGGLLTFVGQMTVYRIQLWTLKRNKCEDEWVKMHTINMDYDITGLFPLFMTKNGRCLVFQSLNEAILKYDLEEDELEKVLEKGDQKINYRMSFQHVNTLVSWDNFGPVW